MELKSLGLHRPELRAWALYDWANSAFVTVITAAVLPPFFSTYYAAGLEPARATTLYGLVVSLSVLITAALAPWLGALADATARKKPLLAACTAAGVCSTALLFFVGRGDWAAALALVLLGGVSISAAGVFYDALLPGIAAPEEYDRVSSAGYALGYMGGGLLLLLDVLWILRPAWFGMPDAAFATRCAFLSVAVWWAVFSLPVFLRVSEPPARRAAARPFADLVDTLRHLRRHRDLFVFLLAFWFYNDGVATIIRMATIYGAEIGIEMRHLILALLLTQFIAFPCAFLFGALADRIGPRRSIYLALWVYVGISAAGYFMTRPLHFYLLAALVGTVQGGAQALSRSLFTRMVPRSQAGKFFGFYAVFGHFSGIAGPAVFALATHLTGQGRAGILSIVFFFLVGMAILGRVDLSRGVAQAREETAA